MDAESYYDQSAPQEWERLVQRRTEFAVTMRALDEFLPAPPNPVLDLGGGPGRYAIALARRGYQVTLVDVSAASLRLARVKAAAAGVELAAVIHADARDLRQLAPAAYEAVIMLGPLYHLLNHDQRIQAIDEALRVLKPGGVLAAAFITRFAPFRYLANGDPAWLVANPAYPRQLWETGVHDRPTNFARAYYVHPDEVIPLMESCKLHTLRLLGCEGVVAGHDGKVNALEGDAWEAWVDLNYRLGQEPTLFGASDHLLYVGTRPRQAVQVDNRAGL